MAIDAERWLASRGIHREPMVPDGRSVGAAPAREAPGPPIEIAAPRPREVIDLANQSALDSDHRLATDGRTDSIATQRPDEARTSRSSDVEAALAFVRRSTSNAPQSEGRLWSKLLDRGHDPMTIERALERAREDRLVDDDAILDALILERRSRGHADRRLRRDLRDRGFSGPQVDAALERASSTDPAAAAFAVAREQAARHRTVDAEVAVRRTVGALLRRGHAEALARKAARDAVYADREPRRTSER